MSGDADDTYRCEDCGKVFDGEDAIRRRTMGGLDPEKWQVFCCPACGRRVETVFTGME